LDEDRKLPQPVARNAAGGGGGRFGFGGPGSNIISVRWLDETHLVQTREGKSYKVEAVSGLAEPYDGPMPVETSAGPPRGRRAPEAAGGAGPRELATPSPDGQTIAFIRDNDLWAADAKSGAERRLTTGATDTLRQGKATWVYFEEIFNRNWKAFWWSPDS